MNAYITYPSKENYEAIHNLERNISKINAELIKETIQRKEYDDNTKLRVFREVINYFTKENTII